MSQCSNNTGRIYRRPRPDFIQFIHYRRYHKKSVESFNSIKPRKRFMVRKAETEGQNRVTEKKSTRERQIYGQKGRRKELIGNRPCDRKTGTERHTFRLT